MKCLHPLAAYSNRFLALATLIRNLCTSHEATSGQIFVGKGQNLWKGIIIIKES